MPPKPPLLMTSTWSPSRASATMAATSASRFSNTAALSPIGASASAASQPRFGGVAEHLVGASQAARQLGLHGAELHGVRARLQHREDARRADPAAQAFDGGGDRRRMMGEVVIDGHAADRAAHFEPALDALETCRSPPGRLPTGTPAWRAATSAARRWRGCGHRASRDACGPTGLPARRDLELAAGVGIAGLPAVGDARTARPASSSRAPARVPATLRAPLATIRPFRGKVRTR